MNKNPAKYRRPHQASRLITVALLCASVVMVGNPSPAAAAVPVEEMGCRMVVFDNLWEHPYSRDGMVSKYRGCKVQKAGRRRPTAQ